jgi:hypothetical protein
VGPSFIFSPFSSFLKGVIAVLFLMVREFSGVGFDFLG